MNKETLIFQDRFLSWDEAVIFIDTHLSDYRDWYVQECRVVKLDGIWNAGITFIRQQGELFD